MATEPAAASRAPRPWLLVLLAVAIVAYVATQMFSGGAAQQVVSTGGPRPSGPAAERVDPSDLDVRIEALGTQPAGPIDVGRNPFRFQPKPQPPPPPPVNRTPVPTGPPPAPQPPPPPPGPPPISTFIKFIGIVETGREKIGAFSDCRYTFSGREGELVEGRFRVVRIGVESAVVEYADGTGRMTLPLNGQGCVK